MSKQKVDYLKLVETNGKSIFCDSMMVAEKFGVDHNKVVRTILHFKSRFERIKVSRMSTLKLKNPPTFVEHQNEYRGQKFTFYKMNKPAFEHIASKFKTDIALEWQLKFIDAFDQMEQTLLQIDNNKKNQEWVETRKVGKLIRNTETDTVKLFIDYATEQGSSNAKFYYANISKMQNKALFLLDQKYKNVRELLDVEQLWTIASADKIVIKALKDGMNNKMNYKNIYQLAKTNVETFAAIHGKSAIPDTKLRLVG